MDILIKYEEYLKARNQSLVYKNFIKKFLDYCEINKIDYFQINQDIITNFFNQNSYSANSKNNFIKSGRSYGKFLEISDNQNAWFKIKLLEVKRKIRTYMTLEDVQNAIKYITTYNPRLNSQKIEIVLYFLFYTGIRKGECYNLKRTDFNFEDCLVKIYASKTKEEKIIPFPEKIRDKINQYFQSEPEENNAFNLNKGNLEYLFRAVISKHLGKKLSPHNIRHGSAKYILNRGVPITVLQKLLGHKSIQTTLIYAEADKEEIERNYRQKIG